MDSKELFVRTVRETKSLPALLLQHADEVQALEEHQFDNSYITFLDEQIALAARGPEWTARLTRRKAALEPFCGVTLLRGRIEAGDTNFTVEIQPEMKAVIHWEEYLIEAK